MLGATGDARRETRMAYLYAKRSQCTAPLQTLPASRKDNAAKQAELKPAPGSRNDANRGPLKRPRRAFLSRHRVENSRRRSSKASQTSPKVTALETAPIANLGGTELLVHRHNPHRSVS